MKNMKFFTVLLAAALCMAGAGGASAFDVKRQVFETLSRVAEPSAAKVSAAGEVEMAFSPRGGAESLILKVINSSKSELRVMGYSFTSANVAGALIAAQKRGVDVKVVVDHDHNAQDRSGKARAALSALSTSGVQVRTISSYAIAHDKVVLSDGRNLQTGSFNFSAAAEKSNSENVLVLWNNPQAVAVYLKHFERNWRQGADWRTAY